jgi:hypothetical protein
MFPASPRGQPAEAEVGLSEDQPYSSAIPAPKDLCYKPTLMRARGQEDRRSGSARSNDERANIMNSSGYRGQNPGFRSFGSARAASGYSSKLQAYAHSCRGKLPSFRAHCRRACDAILVISVSFPPIRAPSTHSFRSASNSKKHSSRRTAPACAKSRGHGPREFKMNKGAVAGFHFGTSAFTLGAE